MLSTIGVESLEDLFDTIPEDLRTSSWEVPPGMSEMAARDLLAQLAAKNNSRLTCFLGGGVYDHFVPAAVDALASRGEFYTAYTPYQPECAQGTLQSIYEYQSAICRLTQMDFANASLYDGGTALFEAVTMSVRLTKRRRALCMGSINPTYRRMLDTHVANLDLDVADVPDALQEPLDDVACVLVQNPDFLGTLHDYSSLAERCRGAGALLVIVFYPVSLGIVKTPGEMGADIAVAEGQCLGMPLNFGGPYLGVMAVRAPHVLSLIHI